jgi:hypothetical protein
MYLVKMLSKSLTFTVWGELKRMREEKAGSQLRGHVRYSRTKGWKKVA